MQNFSIWVRSNFFIPDAKKFWLNSAVKDLSSFLSKNNIDAIVSTGPPHTTHLIARKVAKKNEVDQKQALWIVMTLYQDFYK